MIKYIFDVDGTLTPSRQPINPEFKKWFIDFCINNEVYLVTGSDYVKTQQQLGDDLLRWPIFVYNCSGSDVWAKGENIRSKTWNVPDELYDILHRWLKQSQFPARTGNHIEHRPGTINFSIVGRSATLGERKLYVKWDTEHQEREKIAQEINKKFHDITATIGGETGLDIHPTGADKSQILDDFQDTDVIYFFGDRMNENGNDYSLAKKLSSPCIPFAVENWKQTWEILLNVQKKP